jgi:hypothetical protein
MAGPQKLSWPHFFQQHLRGLTKDKEPRIVHVAACRTGLWMQQKPLIGRVGEWKHPRQGTIYPAVHTLTILGQLGWT